MMLVRLWIRTVFSLPVWFVLSVDTNVRVIQRSVLVWHRTEAEQITISHASLPLLLSGPFGSSLRTVGLPTFLPAQAVAVFPEPLQARTCMRVSDTKLRSIKGQQESFSCR